MLALADKDKPLPHFPLNRNFRARSTIKNSEVESQNVIGLLPGSDPQLKNEYVVFSAHLDHLGVGAADQRRQHLQRRDGRWVGRRVADRDRRHAEAARSSGPKRSVLFRRGDGRGERACWVRNTSRRNPTVPKKNIVADINVDMFLPLFPLKSLEVQGLDESTLGARHSRGLPESRRDRAGRSGAGAQSFYPQRSIQLHPAGRSRRWRSSSDTKRVRPRKSIAKDWLRDRYHAPSDDLNQPVDKTAAAKFNRIMLDLGEQRGQREGSPALEPGQLLQALRRSE